MTPDPPTMDVQKVARLARLELTPEETELFTTQLASILAYATLVQEVETTDVPPTSHPTSDARRWRDDTPTPSLARDVVLEGAPGASVAQGLFRVPKVL